jgi:hypothetical protein
MIFVIPIILGAAAIASAAFGGVKAVEAVSVRAALNDPDHKWEF